MQTNLNYSIVFIIFTNITCKCIWRMLYAYWALTYSAHVTRSSSVLVMDVAEKTASNLLFLWFCTSSCRRWWPIVSTSLQGRTYETRDCNFCVEVPHHLLIHRPLFNYGHRQFLGELAKKSLTLRIGASDVGIILIIYDVRCQCRQINHIEE